MCTLPLFLFDLTTAIAFFKVRPLKNRAEICQIFLLFFWKNDTKFSFWNYLTFSCNKLALEVGKLSHQSDKTKVILQTAQRYVLPIFCPVWYHIPLLHFVSYTVKLFVISKQIFQVAFAYLWTNSFKMAIVTCLVWKILRQWKD